MASETVRELAECMAGRSTREGSAMAYAILDLADAVREHGEAVHEGLDNIEAGMAFLTEAIQELD